MFKKIKELKLKVKISVIAFIVVFVLTVILAIYSTVKVHILEDRFENFVKCGSFTCEKTNIN
jgi:ABC-type amino acid transport system permease subunit